MKKEKILKIKSEIEGAQFEITRNIKKQKNSRDKSICMANYNRLESILTKLEEIIEKGKGVIDEECEDQTAIEFSGEKQNTSTKKPEK